EIRFNLRMPSWRQLMWPGIFVGVFIGSGLAHPAVFNCWPCLLGKLAAFIFVGGLMWVLFKHGVRYPRILAGALLMFVAVTPMLLLVIYDSKNSVQSVKPTQTRTVPVIDLKDRWTWYCRGRGWDGYDEKTHACIN